MMDVPDPAFGWDVMWARLRGYVLEAVEDGKPFVPDDVLAYMRDLEKERRAPIKAWIEEIGRE